MTPTIDEKIARRNATLDERVRALAGGQPRFPVRVLRAADMSAEQRARYGFAADFEPREPRRKRGRR